MNVGNGDQGNILYIYTYYTHIYIYTVYIYIYTYIYTLPKSDIAPENGPSQKEKVVSQPPNPRGEVYTEILWYEIDVDIHIYYLMDEILHQLLGSQSFLKVSRVAGILTVEKTVGFVHEQQVVGLNSGLNAVNGAIKERLESPPGPRSLIIHPRGRWSPIESYETLRLIWCGVSTAPHYVQLNLVFSPLALSKVSSKHSNVYKDIFS